MRKILSFALMALVTQFVFAGQSFAETKEEKLAAKVKAGVTKLGTGPDARIKIKLKDKTKLEGYIVESDPSQVVVMDAKTGEAVPVSYPAVKQVSGNNLSTGVKIAIGIGIALAVILLVTIVAGSQLN